MKGKTKSYLLLLVLLVTGMGTFVSCNDYDSDVRADLQGQLGDLNGVVSGQITHLQNVDDYLERLADSLSYYVEKNDYKQDTATIWNAIRLLRQNAQTAGQVSTTVKDSMDVLKQQFGDSLAVYNTKLIQLNSQMNSGLATINGDLLGINNSLAGVRDSLGTALSGVVAVNTKLDSCIALWTPTITQVVMDASYALALARQDSVAIENLTVSVTHSLDSARLAIQTAQTNYQLAIAYADKADSLVLVQAKSYTDTEVSTLKSAYEAADLVLMDSINQLRADINAMISKYEVLNNKVANLITGIIIQGTENPIFGRISLPVNVNSNILAAYYGTVGSYDVEFPTNDPTNYAKAAEADNFNPQIASELVAEAGKTLVSTAGNLYVTINPTNVNFNNVQATLVNSRDEAAPGYAPLMLQPSDKLLSFGMGRGASANGFYEAAATVNNPSAAKPDVNTGALKEVVKDVLNKLTHPRSSSINLTNAVATVMQEINDVLPAYGVKVTWDDTDVDGNPTTNSVYSEYKIAATALPALSYSFLVDGTSYTLPRIPSLESKGLIFDHFEWDDVDPITMDPISVTLTIPDANNVKVEVDGVYQPVYNVVADSVMVPDSEGNYYWVIQGVHIEVEELNFADVDLNFTTTIGQKDTTITIDVPYDEFNKVIASLNDQVGGMMGEVNSIIDQVNGMVNRVDNSFINRVNSLIARLEKVLQNPNKLLQIAMLYESNGTFAQLSAVKQAPSIMKLNGRSEGAIVLYPTSYTAELFAPAYKKYVAVTSVTGADDNAAALAYANSGANMNKVIDGDVRSVAFQANQPGIYEIAYSAVDYSGKITTRTFYVEVVK